MATSKVAPGPFMCKLLMTSSLEHSINHGKFSWGGHWLGLRSWIKGWGPGLASREDRAVAAARVPRPAGSSFTSLRQPLGPLGGWRIGCIARKPSRWTGSAVLRLS